MEEDIKNLQEIINLCNEELDNKDNNITAVLDLTDLLSLRNVIKAYKELKENSIPVSSVKEKIEELDEELEIMKVDAMYGRFREYGSKLSFDKRFSYKYGMHDVLKELLEKR